MQQTRMKNAFNFTTLILTSFAFCLSGIDSRVVRKKVIQQVVSLLDREHRLPDNWHLRARTVRSKPNTVYLIYDPADVRLAQSFKQDLIKKGLLVSKARH